MRRRPLLRAAAVGGASYYAGKRASERAQDEAEQNARLAELEQQPAPAAEPPPAAAGVAEQLQQLAALHQQGALSDEEFAAAKAHLLGG